MSITWISEGYGGPEATTMIGRDIRRIRSAGGRYRQRRLVTAVAAVALSGLIAGPAAAATGNTETTAPAAAGSSCPWVTSTPPLSHPVAQPMSSTSLSQEISIVHGHGTSNP